MKRSRFASVVVGLLCLLPWIHGRQAEALDPQQKTLRMSKSEQLFKESVRQILVERCVKCHGPDATKADFDLSTRELLIDSGMVDLDDPASSHLLALVRGQEEPAMPLKEERLSERQIEHVSRWIELGAAYDGPLVPPSSGTEKGGRQISDVDREFWSFRPLTVAAPPRVGNSSWVRTPIDAFILQAQNQRGLHPNPPADRRTLIRRVYFDVVGLPPTPEDVEAFVKDPDSHAYEKLVDRLLASEHYGQRWARHWMDVARFAESHGYEQDYDRRHAYHYRDFLIRAFNEDLPYDQFVRWQLAGDELEPQDPQAMMATGFLGAGVFPTQLTEMEFESARYDELDDMVSTIGVAFLGLSVGCARCHDHKYDPISTRDYYRLAATFSKTIRSEIDLDLQPDVNQRLRAAGPPQKLVKVQVTSEGYPHLPHHADDRGFPHFYPETHFLKRGDVHSKQGVAKPGFLQVLVRNGKDESQWDLEVPEGWQRSEFDRASLAEWMTDPVNGAGHLVARVIANRLWHHHFGRGIVATPNDFGFQGDPPSHPQLLDWLAADLMLQGWRLKHTHKLILTSAVYMQSTAFDEERAKIDRENTYLWRRVPRRLEAEAVRNAMLAVSGQLDTTLYGPGTLDPNMKRRSIYFSIKRSGLIPMMMLFDWPEHLVSIGRRATTTTAPQALLFMNSPQGRGYAEAFAQRLQDRPVESAIADAYGLAFGRPPAPEETELALDFLEQQQRKYPGDESANHSFADFCQVLLSMNEFIYVP